MTRTTVALAKLEARGQPVAQAAYIDHESVGSEREGNPASAERDEDGARLARFRQDRLLVDSHSIGREVEPFGGNRSAAEPADQVIRRNPIIGERDWMTLVFRALSHKGNWTAAAHSLDLAETLIGYAVG